MADQRANQVQSNMGGGARDLRIETKSLENHQPAKELQHELVKQHSNGRRGGRGLVGR